MILPQELKEIEDKILYRLSNSEGNPVDDVDLIVTLQASKAKSQEIQVCPANGGGSVGRERNGWCRVIKYMMRKWVVLLLSTKLLLLS